ncbi:MAG TPA: hypothetical protein VEA40_01965, partial [Ramlibacter sp.]|nr:hypothetical protein [Ramlibacter sp.]
RQTGVQHLLDTATLAQAEVSVGGPHVRLPCQTTENIGLSHFDFESTPGVDPSVIRKIMEK